MRDPYEVLGVSRSASNQEIQQAHQAIIDQYDANGPLSEAVQQQMREANEAFEAIMKERVSGYEQEASQFLDIRRLVNSNRITEADELLEGVPVPRRDAEWYFLKGSVQHSKGWLEDAYENFSRASQMNPNNAEYRAALSQLQWQRNTGQPFTGYAQPAAPLGGVGCSVCDVCTTIYCASCCANCLTGCCCRH